MSRDHAAGWADRRSITPPAAISIRDDAPRHERQLAKTLSLSVRPTYQASAAKPSAARFRPLQAVVGRPGMRLQVARAAKEEATSGLSVRLAQARQSSRPRGEHCSRLLGGQDERRAKRFWWRASRRSATASEGAAAKARQSERPHPDGCPRGPTSSVGTATSYLAAEVQSSSPRRPREGATGRNQPDSRRNAIPAAGERQLQQWQTAAQTTLKPVATITLQPRDIAAGCLAITLPVAQTAEAQRPRSRSRFTPTLPDTSGS